MNSLLSYGKFKHYYCTVSYVFRVIGGTYEGSLSFFFLVDVLTIVCNVQIFCEQLKCLC
jgi:hypothetical protein